MIGYGAIGQTALRAARDSGACCQLSALLLRPGRERPADLPENCTIVHDAEALLDCGLCEVFECASHQAVNDYVEPLLRAGANVSLISVGTLANPELLERLRQAAALGGTKLSIMPGALPGIEALAAARLAGLEAVTHTIIKPPHAWHDTPARDLVKLDMIEEEAVFFHGTPRLAARDYPRNANAAAAIALAGLGMEATRTVLVAAPGSERNQHLVEAKGAFGTMKIEIEGAPLANNPKTSLLAALSVARAIASQAGGIVI